MAFTNKLGRTETSLSEINVTPFVDVVLVLLIIFMLTAPVLQSGIEVNVPKTKTVKAISEERLVISITKSQEVYLGSDHVRLDELGDLLHKKIRDPQGQAVYVRADQDVAFGAFATVMSTVKQAGISNVSIVTEPIPVPKNP
jgi:biopolymer transport protein ExbD/biopolymer transport protein TolR